VHSGDVALLRSKWSLAGTGPDGKPVAMSGNGTEVVRRQADGTWLFVIDNPAGAD
jgi:ketosteroid isomerase-like protein